jgi:SanA protein
VRQDEPTAGRNPPLRKPPFKERLKSRLLIELGFFGHLTRKWSFRVLVVALHLALVFAGCYFAVGWSSNAAIYQNPENVPAHMVGLVLGCVKQVHGRPNAYFDARVDAADKLYKAHKVRYLLVSGDNSRKGYDETTDLKAALIARGVPADHIYCDYAGFRTLDSVVRAKKVFGQDDCIIISQRFHNQRAIFLARRNGMPGAVAFDAAHPEGVSGFWITLREVGARVMAVYDALRHAGPRFLGPAIEIGPKSPPQDANPLPAGE